MNLDDLCVIRPHEKNSQMKVFENSTESYEMFEDYKNLYIVEDVCVERT